MINLKIKKNILQRINLIGLDFSFSNLILYLVLAIVVILVISSVIFKFQNLLEIFFVSDFLLFSYSEISMSLLTLLRINKQTTVYISNNVLTSASTMHVRKYTSQNVMDTIFKTKDVKAYENLIVKSVKGDLVDPIIKSDIPPHQVDIWSQNSIKKNNISIQQLINDFNLNDVLKMLKVNNTQIKLMQSQGKQFLYQRTNTIAEYSCMQVVKNKFPFIQGINMTYGQNINQVAAQLTGNAKPDYACCIVMNNGNPLHYYADLKITTLRSFENKIIKLHPNSMINTNIYWIRDINGTYVFNGLTKVRLEDTYNNVLHYFKTLDPVLAKEMHLKSIAAFNKFKQTGNLCDYNDIGINTPKFVVNDWVKELFP